MLAGASHEDRDQFLPGVLSVHPGPADPLLLQQGGPADVLQDGEGVEGAAAPLREGGGAGLQFVASMLLCVCLYVTADSGLVSCPTRSII